MVTIKKYNNKYKEDVRNVCINSSTSFLSKKMFHKSLLTVFCDYYIEKEGDSCFIAVDNDKAVGYVLCAKNYNIWKKDFENNYLNKTKNPLTKGLGKATIEDLASFSDEYPAHLHIDIDTGYRGQKLGTKLIQYLVSYLKEINVKGLMLCVARDNANAIGFYKKQGFELLKEGKQELYFGMKL